MKRMMWRKMLCAAVAAVLMLVCVPWAGAEETAESQLGWFLELYGFSLELTPPAPEQEATLTCGAAQVTLTEALYDGRWLFAAVHVTPVEGSGSLVMPAMAGKNALTCGSNGELPKTKETFAQAAEAAGKGLFAVAAYPAIFDDPQQVGSYFLDYRMLADGSFVLFSGAELTAGGETADASLRVITQEALDKEAEPAAWTVPATAVLAGPVETCVYVPVEEDAPLTALNLTRTALSMYADPVWEDIMAGTRITLLDAAGEPLPAGHPMTGSTWALAPLEDTLEVELSGSMIGLEPLRLTLRAQE